MYAVVEIAGQQFQVKKKDRLNVPLLEGKPGDKVKFGNLLVGENKEVVSIGTPYLEGNVSAKIIEHGKADKILVFHKKRRKGYSKMNGHRQRYTTIEITDIKF